jgi:hypothetical protein
MPMSDVEPRQPYYVAEFARMTRSKEPAVRRGIKNGNVKAFRIGRRWLIPAEFADNLVRGASPSDDAA